MYCLVLWLDELLFPVFSVFRLFRKIAKERLLALSCLAVLPSVRMEQLGCHWTDFHEI